MSALHTGYARTRSAAYDTEMVNVTREQATNIVDAYNGLKLMFRPEDLHAPDMTDYIARRVYDKVPIKQEMISVLESLAENNIVQVDKTVGKIQFHSEDGLRSVAREQGLNEVKQNELLALHENIKSFFPSKAVESLGRITLTEPTAEVNLGALKVIERQIPEVFSKHVKTAVDELLTQGTLKFDNIQAGDALESLNKELASGDLKKSLVALENLRKSVPGMDKLFDDLGGVITKRHNAGDVTDLMTFELAGTGKVYDALANRISQENIHSDAVEKCLLI